jgi:hypothetical protein
MPSLNIFQYCISGPRKFCDTRKNTGLANEGIVHS